MTCHTSNWAEKSRGYEGLWLPVRQGPGRLELLRQLLYPTRNHFVSFLADLPDGRAEVQMVSPGCRPADEYGQVVDLEGIGSVTLTLPDHLFVHGWCSLVRVRQYAPMSRMGKLQFFLSQSQSTPRRWEILSVLNGELRSGQQAEVLLFDHRQQSLITASLDFDGIWSGGLSSQPPKASLRGFGAYGWSVEVELVKSHPNHLGTLQEIRRK